MVFETRAALLDWYGEVFDEPSAKERAKTLRLDQDFVGCAASLMTLEFTSIHFASVSGSKTSCWMS